MLGRLIHGARISHKLSLISASFMLPIAVLLYFMIDGISRDIRFTALELYGNEYQRPLEDLLRAVPKHEYLAARMAAGEKELESQILGVQSKIDQAMQRVVAVDRRYGADLQFTEEGLGKRQRSSANPRDLQSSWEKLKNIHTSLSTAAAKSQHTQLRATIRTMIQHAGDTSNLILDPDLDSYYLMDITLLALPQTQDRLADVLSEGRTIVSKPELEASDRLRLSVLATLLRESDFDRIVGSTRTAINEDPNFYGVSESMRNVETALGTYMTANESLLAMLEKIATTDAGAGQPVTPDEYESAVDLAIESSFQLWKTAAQELDVLLRIRTSHYSSERLWALSLTVLALAISGMLVYVVAKGITRPLNECVSGLQTLAEKDLTYRLNFTSKGELGEIAAAVDQAADGMREAICSLSESASELQDAAENQTEASQLMSANAEETSTQANVVSTAAEQVSRNTQAVAVAVDELSSSIREIASNAQDAARVGTEAVQLAGSTNATMARLGQSRSSRQSPSRPTCWL
jgi:methyl-accepting chemotaxis protein